MVLGTTSVSGSGDVLTSAKGSDVEESLESGGSGRHSRFDRLQRMQYHSLDLGYLGELSEWGGVKESRGDTHKEARRLRSVVGTSSAPTPIAACPFKGKKPWSPIMAKEWVDLTLRKSHGSSPKCHAPVRTPHAGCHNSS